MNKSAVSGFLFLLLIFIFPLSAEELGKEDSNGIEVLAEESEPDDEQTVSEEIASLEDDDFSYFDDDYLFFEAPDLIVEAPPYEPRSFSEIFPRLNRRIAMNGTGYRYSFETGQSPSLLPHPDSGIDLMSDVMKKEPSHIIEALVLVPYKERELDFLDIYNALGRIENIKDQTLPTSSGKPFQVFKETTRLISASNRKPMADPEPAARLPYSDTMYLRFTDSYIGSLFIRGDMSLDLYGITYNLTNFRDINFSIFRIMKAEKVAINIYLEPTKDGILIYSVSGIDLPGFIMKRLNLTPNINARIRVLIEWITEGLRKQESIEIDDERDTMLRTVIHNNRINRMVRENTN